MAKSRVPLILDEISQNVAGDVEVAFQVHRVIAATKEAVIENLRNDVPLADKTAVKVDGVVMALSFGEDIILDDHLARGQVLLSIGRTDAAPDVLAEVVNRRRRCTWI